MSPSPLLNELLAREAHERRLADAARLRAVPRPKGGSQRLLAQGWRRLRHAVAVLARGCPEIGASAQLDSRSAEASGGVFGDQSIGDQRRSGYSATAGAYSHSSR